MANENQKIEEIGKVAVMARHCYDKEINDLIGNDADLFSIKIVVDEDEPICCFVSTFNDLKTISKALSRCVEGLEKRRQHQNRSGIDVTSSTSDLILSNYDIEKWDQDDIDARQSSTGTKERDFMIIF